MNNCCRICYGNTRIIMNNVKLLEKYFISYFQCLNCGFLQTEKPYWLDESYKDVITYLDLGLLSRSINCVENYKNLADNLIELKLLNFNHKIIDFAGGYGVFVRLLRDAGYNVSWQDEFCENIFSKGFEYHKGDKYDIVTAFEVFEHVFEPSDLLNNLIKFEPEFIFFSTSLIPADIKLEKWWYLSLTTGQHVSFYTEKSLRILANNYNYSYFCNGDFHLFAKCKNLTHNPLLKWEKSINLIIRIINKILKPIKLELKSNQIELKNNSPRNSLLWDDYNLILRKTFNKN
jgi:hypothetical protein